MSSKPYINIYGEYIGTLPQPPPGAFEVPEAPDDADKLWNFSSMIWEGQDPNKALKDNLKAYLASYRWKRETGGITWGGIPVRTDDRSKMLLSGIQKEIADLGDPNHSRKVKTVVGFVDMTDAQLEALYAAVVAHVQKCFDCEDLVLQDINNDIVTTAEGAELAFEAAYAA